MNIPDYQGFFTTTCSNCGQLIRFTDRDINMTMFGARGERVGEYGGNILEDDMGDYCLACSISLNLNPHIRALKNAQNYERQLRRYNQFKMSGSMPE